MKQVSIKMAFNRICLLGAASSFFLFASVVAVLTFYILRSVIPTTPGEARDYYIHYSLPFIFEAGFLIAAAIIWALKQASHSSTNEIVDVMRSSERANVFHVVLSILPILGCCCPLFFDHALDPAKLLLLPIIILIEILLRRLAHDRIFRIGEMIAAVLIIAIFFIAQLVEAPKQTHHWSYYLGPIDGVLAGGHLLWNVPSQYGFLDIALCAFFVKYLHIAPTSFLGVLIGALQLCMCLITAYLLWVRCKVSPLCAALSACAFTFFMAGEVETLSGPASHPSVSGLRFIPSFVALLMLCKAIRTSQLIWIAIAIATGALAILWSFESSLYVLIPMCAYAVLTLLARFWTGPIQKITYLIPLACVGLASATVIIYGIVHNSPTDMTSFYEYALRYLEVIGTLPIEEDALTVLYVFMLAFVYFFARLDFKDFYIKSGTGVIFFAYLWIVSTYYVSRSHPNNVRNIAQIGLLCMLTCAPYIRAKWQEDNYRLGISLMCGLMVVYTMTFANQTNVAELSSRMTSRIFWRPPHFSSPPVEVENYAKNFSNVTILKGYEISKPIEPTTGRGNSLGLSPWRHFQMLPMERRCEYLRRMVTERGEAILIVEPHNGPEEPIHHTLAECGKFFELINLLPIAGWSVYKLSPR